MSSQEPPTADPMPEAPRFADYDACCGSGCDPCLLDLYEQAVEQYRRRLRAWYERHPEAAAPDAER